MILLHSIIFDLPPPGNKISMFSSPYVKACLKLAMWQDTIFSPKSFMQYGQPLKGNEIFKF